MSFADEYQGPPAAESPLLRRFDTSLAPAAPEELERMAQESRRLTEKYFGKTMRLFAPNPLELGDEF